MSEVMSKTMSDVVINQAATDRDAGHGICFGEACLVWTRMGSGANQRREP